jgi:hypothetical protein
MAGFKMRRVCVIVALLAAWPVASLAQPAVSAFVDGAHLQRSCRMSRGGQLAAACEAYVAGVIDYVKLVEWTEIGAGRRSAPSWCEPTGLKSGTAARLVMRRMARHPDDAAKPAAAVVFLALAETYPCNDKTPSAQP